MIDWVVEPAVECAAVGAGARLRIRTRLPKQPVVDRLHFAATKAVATGCLCDGKTLHEIGDFAAKLRSRNSTTRCWICRALCGRRCLAGWRAAGGASAKQSRARRQRQLSLHGAGCKPMARM